MSSGLDHHQFNTDSGAGGFHGGSGGGSDSLLPRNLDGDDADDREGPEAAIHRVRRAGATRHSQDESGSDVLPGSRQCVGDDALAFYIKLLLIGVP